MTSIQNGGAPADYEALYERHLGPGNEPLVQHHWRGVADETAQDILQEVFVKFARLKLLERYDSSKGGFVNYLHFIVRGVVCTFRDRLNRTPLLDTREKQHTNVRPLDEIEAEEDRDPRQPSYEPDLEAQVDARIALEQLLAAEKTPEQARLLEVLIEGGEAKLVADEFGVAASTVSHWRRALREKVAA